MVAFTDLKIYRSTSDLGGAITATQIQTATPNNLFINVSRADYVSGQTFYKCVYLKNTHATEAMDDFKIWISGGTPSPNTYIHFGFEPSSGEYRWDPYFTGDGATTFDSTADTAALDLTVWTCSAWFKTSKADYTARGMIVNKGGDGSDTAGQNLNYGIWVNTTEHLQGGFETGAGTDNFTSSSAGPTVNDGEWHFALIYYDGTEIRLFLDDMVNSIDSLTTSSTPETNAQPVVIGKNSRDDSRYFEGQIDEVRVWNRALTDAEERQALYQSNTVNSSGLVLEKKFGTDTNAVTAQTIANVNTAPTGVTWYESGDIPDSLGRISAGQAFPIWIKLVVLATPSADPVLDDSGIFTVEFDIPQGGTGTGGTGGSGGGTGGNPPPTAPDYKIAFFGDEGCEPETDDLIDLIQNQDYDLIVSVGDHAYESAGCWTTRFNPVKSIFKVSAYGNHEYEESGGTGPYKTFFGNSSTFYKYRFENIMFFVIDSNDDKSGVDLDAQKTWLTNELEAIKNDSTITWRILVMHHPWFGASSDHSYNEFNQVQKFHKLCTDYKVSFVYTGHNHNWQRSKMVAYNSGSPTSPTVVGSTSPYSKNTAGVIHIVTGTGGHDSGGSLYGLGSQPSWQAYQNRSNNGVHELVASNNGQTLTGRFRNNSGDTFDSFTINSGTSGGFLYAPYGTFVDGPPGSLTGGTYLEVPHSSSLNLNNFTVSCWFRTSKDYHDDLAGYMIAKGEYQDVVGADNFNYMLLISCDVIDDNRLEVNWETTAGTEHYVFSDFAVNDGQWHWGVGTWDGTNTKLYVDGVLHDSVSHTGPPNNNTYPLYIGQYGPTFTTYDGDVDEVRIWSTALTATEISNYYTNGVVPQQSSIVYENTFD